jgi:hypothetical protein
LEHKEIVQGITSLPNVLASPANLNKSMSARSS